MKKLLKPMYFLAFYIVVWMGVAGFTLWNMQGRGYDEVGVRKILLSPFDHLYSIRISTNVTTPMNLIPNAAAKNVRITVSSPDGWFALTEIMTGALVLFLFIFALAVFFGRAGGEEKKGGGGH